MFSSRLSFLTSDTAKSLLDHAPKLPCDISLMGKVGSDISESDRNVGFKVELNIGTGATG